MSAPRARALRGILIACLAWWFLYYDFAGHTGGPMPVTGFRWWVDCEDARVRLSRMSSFILAETCTEGEGPPVIVAR